MRNLFLILILLLALHAEDTLTLENLKLYDQHRIRIDSENSQRKGFPLAVNGKQIYTKEDIEGIKPFSLPASEQRANAYKQNVSGSILTITGFVGLESSLALIPLISDDPDGGSGPFPVVLGISLPTLITGIVKLNRGYNNSMRAYQQYEKDLRDHFKIPSYFTVNAIKDAELTPLQCYQNYLNYTVTLSTGRMGRYYNLRVPFEINGVPVDLSSRSAYHFRKQMPDFTPLAIKELERAAKGNLISKLSMSGGASMVSLGGLLAFGGLLASIGGDGPDESFFITTGIILPATGLTAIIASIPIGIRAERRFKKGLKTYDRELRSYYKIDQL